MDNRNDFDKSQGHCYLIRYRLKSGGEGGYYSTETTLRKARKDWREWIKRTAFFGNDYKIMYVIDLKTGESIR